MYSRSRRRGRARGFRRNFSKRRTNRSFRSGRKRYSRYYRVARGGIRL